MQISNRTTGMLLVQRQVVPSSSISASPRARCSPATAATSRSVPMTGQQPIDSNAPGLGCLTAQMNYANLCSNTGELAHRPVSGYAGRWSRYRGGNLGTLLAEGDIIYGFRTKPDAPQVSQVWKAEEGDLNSPKLQAQRASLPQLQKDPLQLQLDMDTLIVEVSAETPLLQPSFASVPKASLASTMKVLAVPGYGNLVITGALPKITGSDHGSSDSQQASATAKPAGPGDASKTWFNRIYSRVPRASSSSDRWSVMFHYDTTSGSLLTHYHTWESGLSPEPQSLKDVFTPGAHKHLMEQAQARHAKARPQEPNIAGYLQRLVSSGKVQCHASRLSYTADLDSCTISSTTSTAPPNAKTDKATTTTSSSRSSFEVMGGGPEPVEVWYDSSSYFKVPCCLDPKVLAGGDVVFEAGVVLGAGQNDVQGLWQGVELVRWLLCYSSTGDEQIKWVQNEVYTSVQH